LLEPFAGVEWRQVDGHLRAHVSPAAFADRLCPVGSYRRQKQEMKDIELLMIPRVAELPDPADLFGGKRLVNVTLARIDELVASGILGKRHKCDGALSAWGENNRHAVHLASGLPVDFFFCTPESWWNRLVVTTGPRESNIRIASLARKIGWEWEVAEAGFVPRGGTWAECTKTRRTMRSEREVFEFVGLQCSPPERR
jgi:DNA polymerase/3'-5' exonuclease PolX